MERILSLNVENHPGVLARIAGMFSSKGYNVDSLTVGPTIDPTVSRITVACDTNDAEFEQIKKQLNRLVDVIKVIELTKKAVVSKELLFLKLSAKLITFDQLYELTVIYDCAIVSKSQTNYILQVCETPENVKTILKLIPHHAIMEMSRSGLTSILQV